MRLLGGKPPLIWFLRRRVRLTVGMFKLFAELIAFHLDAQESLRASDAKRREERRTVELREPYAMRQRRGAQASSSSASRFARSSAARSA